MTKLVTESLNEFIRLNELSYEERYIKEMEKESMIEEIVNIERNLYPEWFDDKYDVRDRIDRLGRFDYNSIKELFDKRQNEEKK